jgi:hypothetical protein
MPVAPVLSVADAAKAQVMPTFLVVDTSPKHPPASDPIGIAATTTETPAMWKNVRSPIAFVPPQPDSPAVASVPLDAAGALASAMAVAAASAAATVRGGGVGEMIDRSAPWDNIVEVGGGVQQASSGSHSSASGGQGAAPSGNGVNLHSLVQEWAGLGAASAGSPTTASSEKPARKGKWVNGQWVVPL